MNTPRTERRTQTQNQNHSLPYCTLLPHSTGCTNTDVSRGINLQKYYYNISIYVVSALFVLHVFRVVIFFVIFFFLHYLSFKWSLPNICEYRLRPSDVLSIWRQPRINNPKTNKQTNKVFMFLAVTNTY